MAETVTKKHPIRAALWGLVAGIGVLMLLTVAFPVIALDTVSQVVVQGVIVVLIVMVLSVIWGLFGPAKAPKGPPPAPAAAEPAMASMEPMQATTEPATAEDAEESSNPETDA